MSEVFWGIFWLVCLFGLITGVIGLGKDTYNETSKRNQEDTRTFLIIVGVVLVVTAIFTIT